MPDLRARFQTLEASKAELITSIASLSPAILNKKPDEATWSILQVIAHLTKSEALTLQYIKKKTQDPSLLPAPGLKAWLGLGVLRAYLSAQHRGIRSPFRIKAPSSTGDVPDSGELQPTSFAWAGVREDWRGFIETFPPALSGKVIFRHPFVGYLGPNQVMIFLEAHLTNHTRQIGRIRKALGV